MKKVLLTLLALSCFIASNFAVNSQNWKQKVSAEVEGISPDLMQNMDMNTFLEMTPKKYKQMTGEKLGFKKTLQLKLGQKYLKNKIKANAEAGSDDIPEALYIVLAIFWLGWLAMGILDDFEGNNWWIGLICYALFWLPGVIFTLIKKKEYY